MKLEEEWVESFLIVFLALGFIISVLLKSPFYTYVSIFLSGFIGGRVYYIKRYKEPILPFILIIVGFLFGYLLGSLWVSRVVVVLFFALGFMLSYYLHLKKILVIFKSKSFLK
jgi:hypothetical protein